MKHFVEYVEDRYPIFENAEIAAYDYKLWLEENGYSTIEKHFGFINYKFEGDACIVQDLFVSREFRHTKKGWELFNQVLELARKAPKCNVMIATSEKVGINHEVGVGAMIAAKFILAYTTDSEHIFMRGTQ